MMQALAAEDNVSLFLAPSCCLILLIAIALVIRDELQRLFANDGEGAWIFFHTNALEVEFYKQNFYFCVHTEKDIKIRCLHFGLNSKIH